MLELQNKQVLVIGLSSRGWAACEFLLRSGARVVGIDNDLDFHEAVQVLSNHVKRAFLVGESSGRMRKAWSVFTPCTIANSLLKAVAEATKNVTSGGVVLLSPACSSWDQFRNHQHRGEVFCQAVKSIGRGVHGGTPNIGGKNSGCVALKRSETHKNFAWGFCEEEPRSKAN
jgi:UDP-N-acetylmuramoylalanine-D-glutamate ligase